MSVTFFNQWTKRPHGCPETNTGELITETSGYRSEADQINAFLIAGQRLEAARQGLFNTDDELDDENFYNEDDSPENEVLNVKPGVVSEVRARKRDLTQAALIQRAEQEARMAAAAGGPLETDQLSTNNPHDKQPEAPQEPQPA